MAILFALFFYGGPILICAIVGIFLVAGLFRVAIAAIKGLIDGWREIADHIARGSREAAKPASPIAKPDPEVIDFETSRILRELANHELLRDHVQK